MRVVKGSLLRSALLRNGVSPHNDKAMYVNCRGLGTCGTCAVEVVGNVVPQEWGTQERLRLNFPPHNPSSSSHLRLACQVRVEGDVKVIKYNKFWGQGDVVLGPLSEDEFELPFGELEFFNDRTAPKGKMK
jgi:ferredoxin